MAKRYRDAGCFHDQSHVNEGTGRLTSRRRTLTRRALKVLEHRNTRRQANARLAYDKDDK